MYIIVGISFGGISDAIIHDRLLCAEKKQQPYIWNLYEVQHMKTHEKSFSGHMRLKHFGHRSESTIATMKHDGGNVLLWGCFSSAGTEKPLGIVRIYTVCVH